MRWFTSLYIVQIKKADSKHGKRFKEVCKQINTKFGVDVPLEGSFVSLTDEGMQRKNANKENT